VLTVGPWAVGLPTSGARCIARSRRNYSPLQVQNTLRNMELMCLDVQRSVLESDRTHSFVLSRLILPPPGTPGSTNMTLRDGVGGGPL
jgi:hypothetical protein